MEEWAASEWQCHEQEQGCEADLGGAESAGAGNAGSVSEGEDVARESDRAGQAEAFAETESGEQRTDGAGWRREEDEAGESDQSSGERAPARGGHAVGSDAGDDAEEWHDDD